MRQSTGQVSSNESKNVTTMVRPAFSSDFLSFFRFLVESCWLEVLLVVLSLEAGATASGAIVSDPVTGRPDVPGNASSLCSGMEATKSSSKSSCSTCLRT